MRGDIMDPEGDLLLDDLEGLLAEINAFSSSGAAKGEDISASLERYLKYVAISGNIVFPWSHVKLLFRSKILHSMDQFPGETFPNNETFVMERFDQFRGAPFTIQRLTELVMEPTRHYKRKEKYLRALEKAVLVVTTVDPWPVEADQNGDYNDSDTEDMEHSYGGDTDEGVDGNNHVFLPLQTGHSDQAVEHLIPVQVTSAPPSQVELPLDGEGSSDPVSVFVSSDPVVVGVGGEPRAEDETLPIHVWPIDAERNGVENSSEGMEQQHGGFSHDHHEGTGTFSPLQASPTVIQDSGSGDAVGVGVVEEHLIPVPVQVEPESVLPDHPESSESSTSDPLAACFPPEPATEAKTEDTSKADDEKEPETDNANVTVAIALAATVSMSTPNTESEQQEHGASSEPPQSQDTESETSSGTASSSSAEEATETLAPSENE